MNHNFYVIVSVIISAYTMPIIADNKIYKCEIDGKMVYQQSRCPTKDNKELKNNKELKVDSNKPTDSNECGKL